MSRSIDARLMIAPAARAALMAMLSMGWRFWDMVQPAKTGQGRQHTCAQQGLRREGKAIWRRTKSGKATMRGIAGACVEP
jgi:hypothetical protein